MSTKLNNLFSNSKEINNSFFNEWIEFSTKEIKDKLNLMSRKEIEESFDGNHSIKDGSISSRVGIGSSKINVFTINRIFRAIN